MNKYIIVFTVIAASLILSISSCKKSDTGDGTVPEIVVLGYNPLSWALDFPYEDPGATAYDVTTAGDTVDITSLIVVTSDVDVSVLGEYQVKYNVQDESGVSAEEKVRIVKVVQGK